MLRFCMAWIYRRANSGFWWIGTRANGRLISKSTGETKEAKAKEQLATLEAMEAAQRAGRLNRDFFEALTPRRVGWIKQGSGFFHLIPVNPQARGLDTGIQQSSCSEVGIVYRKPASRQKPLQAPFSLRTMSTPRRQRQNACKPPQRTPCPMPLTACDRRQTRKARPRETRRADYPPMH